MSGIAVSIILLLLLAGCGSSSPSPSEPLPLPRPSRDVRVLDADTIDIDGTRYRLHGIDAPESYQTCRAWGHTWECGKAATQAFRSHIEGISCSEASTDRYGRAVGHCSVGDEDINAWLVRNGWAIAYYSADYVNEEAQAKAARLGIHRGQYVEPCARRKGACRATTPWLGILRARLTYPSLPRPSCGAPPSLMGGCFRTVCSVSPRPAPSPSETGRLPIPRRQPPG